MASSPCIGLRLGFLIGFVCSAILTDETSWIFDGFQVSDLNDLVNGLPDSGFDTLQSIMVNRKV